MMAATVTFVLDDERGWVVADSVSTACPHCEAKLKVKPEKIGGIAHCPNCQRLICLQIGVSQPANPSERPSGNSELLATEESPEDTRLSAATARQIIDSLDDRGKCAVLITVPIDRIQSFNNLEGLPFAIASSEAMSSEDTAHFLMSVATNLYKHLGLQPTTN